jgi:hypothetical protein
MKTHDSIKIAIWQKHMTAAESDPIGRTFYLKQQGINPSTYYRWRDIILNQEPEVSIVKPKAKTKKKISPFLPVVVDRSSPITSTPQSCHRVPDAKWLAEIILEIHARCL